MAPNAASPSVVALAVALALGGCGDESTGGGGAGAGSGTGGAASTGTTGPGADITFDTGPWEAAPEAVTECFFTDIVTTEALYLVGVSGTQSPGGHHLTVYTTSAQEPPARRPCVNAEMADWQLVGGVVGPEASLELFDLPEGFAIRVAPGQQIVVGAHYVNTTGAPQTVQDTVTLHTAPASAASVVGNFWRFSDESFSVPPFATAERQTFCTVAEPLDSLLVFGHMHEYGQRFTLERVDEDGNALGLVYDKLWISAYASEPPSATASVDDPIHFDAGTILRMTCAWDNPTSDALTHPEEMCAAYALYFPDQGSVLECAPTDQP